MNKMSVWEVLKSPVVTEKSVLLKEETSGEGEAQVLTFKVNKKAGKEDIRAAVEEIFGVKVENVNTQNYKGKKKRVGRYFGYTAKRKKAIVQLTSDSKELDFFEGV